MRHVKILPLLIMASLLAGGHVFAAEEGKIGDKLYYSYDAGSNELHITGSGLPYNYVDYSELPWALHYAEIEKVTLESGAKMRLWMIREETAAKCNKLGELETVFEKAGKEFPNREENK